MFQLVSPWLNYIFIALALLSFLWFFIASGKNKAVGLSCFLLLVIHTVLSLLGIYQEVDTLPPPLVLGIILTFIAMVCFALLPSTSNWRSKFNLKTLCYFHFIRVAVEIILDLLYNEGVISIYQTFEGVNFDILSGLTAPLIAYYGFTKRKISRKGIIIWNVIAMLLLINVVIFSSLAFPSSLQQIAFDQPNIAISYFPFTLLPTFIVPLVLLAHLITIKQLSSGHDY